MITVRDPETIYQARGAIEHGTFAGRWHFSFDQYRDPTHVHFGRLRVFNDDTLSPGAVWPLHPHREIEVVTYCAGGEFRHEDEHGKGGVLRKGWVQHTTVGRGMWHSEINNRADQTMRFIQMWFFPEEVGLEPSVEQKPFEKGDRTNRFVTVVGRGRDSALPIRSAAEVRAAFLERDREASVPLPAGWGAYLYVLEGGGVLVNGERVQPLGAAEVTGEPEVRVRADDDAELLLVLVALH